MESNQEENSHGTDNHEVVTENPETSESVREPTKDGSTDGQEKQQELTNNTETDDEDNPTTTNNEAEGEPKLTQSILTTKEDNATAGVLNSKLVQQHYTTHVKSSLPHILTEYGMEEKENKYVQIEKVKRRRKSRKSQHDEEEDDADDRARRRAREMKFRQTYGDSRETDSYYAEYIDFLQEKVARQRQEQRDREEAAKLAAIKALEEKPRYTYVRKLERVELKHDATFKKDLPKTDISRIVRLQDQLKKDGKLKTQGDVDRFWSDIRKPDVFYQHFNTDKQDKGSFEPLINENYNRNSKTNPGHKDVRPLSHISESSATTDHDQWAVTQKFTSTHGASPERSRKSSSKKAKEAAVELERRCPKRLTAVSYAKRLRDTLSGGDLSTKLDFTGSELELPTLTCHNLLLGEKPPDPADILKKAQFKARQKARKIHTLKVRKMYQLAMRNSAAATRMLAEHFEFKDSLEGACLRDIHAQFCGNKEKFVALEEPPQLQEIEMGQYMIEQALADAQYPYTDAFITQEPFTPPSSAGSSNRPLPPISTKDDPISTKDDDKQLVVKPKKNKKKMQLAKIEEPIPLPLSYDELFSREKTIEAKCLSTLWTNYSGAMMKDLTTA